MDALVMCGGQGSRLDAPVEKPLFEVGGVPMAEHVRAALADSSVDTVYGVPAPQTPETRAFLESRSVPCIETAGEGYVSDLQTALDAVSRPVVTVAADLPLLDGPVVDRVISQFEGRSRAVAVPAALKDTLGVSYDRSFEDGGRRLVPAGLNVVGSTDEDLTHCSYDARVAVNVNRLSDAAVAETLLESGGGDRGP
jgi:adenosylcobinamide-phosphate guanylyltransferase